MHLRPRSCFLLKFCFICDERLQMLMYNYFCRNDGVHLFLDFLHFKMVLFSPKFMKAWETTKATKVKYNYKKKVENYIFYSRQQKEIHRY